MKKSFVNEMREGDDVYDCFLVEQVDVRTTRAGKSFISARLRDRTGVIDAVLWDNVDQSMSVFGTSVYVMVAGRVGSYDGNTQVTMKRVSVVDPEEIDYEDFFPAASRDRDDLEQELRTIIAGMNQNGYRALLEHMFSDTAFTNTYLHSPAARNVHHAYVGGLAEHSLSVCRAVVHLYEVYPQAHVDLLKAGALLHDVGKTEELMFGHGLEYSDTGMLIGHTVLGVGLIQRFAQRVSSLGEAELTQLIHIVVSHHGTREWGAPVEPCTLESFIIHAADNLDAKVQMLRQAADTRDVHRPQWSQYVRTLNRSLFVDNIESHTTE